MAVPRQRFRAEVRKQGRNYYVVVPGAVSAAFAAWAERGRIRARGVLEGVEIRGTLVPRGGGHWLFLHAGMRAAAGVDAGATVELELVATPWEEIPLPDDARSALSEAGALRLFEVKSPNHRHELLRWVETATSPGLRARRVRALVAEILGATEPVKKGRASRRDKPLWICPDCGHRFVNRNQWHSCRRYTLEQVFAKSRSKVRGLFDRLRAMVESVGPAHLQAYRDHVAFVVRVRFMGATPRVRWLDVGFWLPRRVDSPRFHKVETLTPTDHVHLLRITEAAQLDEEVLGWIREGYEVGEQKHLA